jgi:hypothetical protein
MWKFSMVLLVAFFLFVAAARVRAQEPPATPTVAAGSTAEVQATPTSTVVPPSVEAPPAPANVRLFILGSYARLEWDFAPRPNEGPPRNFTLRVVVQQEPPVEIFSVPGDARAFDFPPRYLPRCGGPRIFFGVSALVEAGASDYVDQSVDFGTDCDIFTDDEITPAAGGSVIAPPDAGTGMRDEDWTAVMVIASIALVGLLCIALGMSVEEERPQRR